MSRFTESITENTAHAGLEHQRLHVAHGSEFVPYIMTASKRTDDATHGRC